MMEVIAIDGFKLSMCGDCLDTLLWVERHGREIVEKVAALMQADEILLHESDGGQLVEVKAGEFVSDRVIAGFARLRTYSP